MKNKQEILESIDLIIGGINKIINNSKLLKSTDERVKEKIPAFTRYCPFSNYYELTENTLTYPFSCRKFDKKYLKIRQSFWIKLYQIIEAHQFLDNDKMVNILRFTIKEADVITFNKFSNAKRTVCPVCENPYPHLLTNGAYECEECGCNWRKN